VGVLNEKGVKESKVSFVKMRIVLKQIQSVFAKQP